MLNAYVSRICGFLQGSKLTGWFAIKWLIDYLSRRSLYVFAIYCAVAGVICIAFGIF